MAKSTATRTRVLTFLRAMEEKHRVESGGMLHDNPVFRLNSKLAEKEARLAYTAAERGDLWGALAHAIEWGRCCDDATHSRLLPPARAYWKSQANRTTSRTFTSARKRRLAIDEYLCVRIENYGIGDMEAYTIVSSRLKKKGLKGVSARTVRQYVTSHR